jgi:hypothetical protein
MAVGSHYLELEQVPMTFDPLEQTKGTFFDQTNFQMFCVQSGFTSVKVKSLKEEENFHVTIPQRGQVKSIKFSGGTPKILSVQTRTNSVEFVNVFVSENREQSLPLKQHPGSNIVGFYWIFQNEFIVIITTTHIELYQCNPHNLSFKLLKNYSLNISWAVYSPSEHMLIVCAKGGNYLHPFYFKSGVSMPIVRLPKIEIELGPSRDPKASLKERDVFVMNLYSVVYIAVIRTSLQGGPGFGSEVLLYQQPQDGQAKLVNILVVDIPGRCTLSVVDNLVVVHHQASKTSMMFEIAFGGTTANNVTRHTGVLAPLPISQCVIHVRNRSGSKTPSPRIVLDEFAIANDSSISAISPELYSSKWIFFQPNIIIEAQYGVIWHLKLNLTAVSNMMTDKSSVVQLLLMRLGGKDIIFDVFKECMEPGRQANLSILAAMFDQLNHAYKVLGGSANDLISGRRYRNAVGQRELYTQVLVPFNDRKDMNYEYMVAVTVEYIRSLNKFEIPVEHFLFELVLLLLIENKCFYQLHQFLQYHVISDSKPLATLLLSRELVYSPATQLAMDMFKRLGTADSEIIDILLSRGQILSALRFVKSCDKVDTVSARVFLEAAANEDDKMLFYTVYKFFEDRNVKLRKKKEFPPDEQCQEFEELFNKWFKPNND